MGVVGGEWYVSMVWGEKEVVCGGMGGEGGGGGRGMGGCRENGG